MTLAQLIIRQEVPPDHHVVRLVVKSAFASEPLSNGTEHILIEKLRKSSAFIPDLSLVAVMNNEIVGHILLTQIKIRDNSKVHPSLALAPVSVLPEYQRKGIGSALIRHAHQIAEKLDFTSIVLIGHADYYPKFDYERASKYGIKFPFEAPDENCMVVALTMDALREVRGMVEYPQEFFD